MIDKVLEHVYISGAQDVLSGYPLLKHEITHVLTVSAVAVPMEKRLPKIDYHFIFAMDLPNQDLLGGGQIAEGITYISKAVQSGGNVLVHCEVGVSRSATVVAAYVMQKMKYPAKKAVDFVKIARPVICPNEGFFSQLLIFEAMDYTFEGIFDCHMYKDWRSASGNVPNKAALHHRLPTLKESPVFSLSAKLQVKYTQFPQIWPPYDIIGSDKLAGVFIRDINTDNWTEKRGCKYRCGKCRHILFFGEHITRHKRADGKTCQFGYLIEPMKWMNVSDYEGKIACPNCDSKLGSYSWGGRHCQGEVGAKCMQHVSPWVHLHRAKVDEVSVKSPIERLQVPRQEVPAVIIS